jgi:DNA-binding MarR family transcriptional regulator
MQEQAEGRKRGDRRIDSDVEELRVLIQSFVRSFGLLTSTQTPCGHPISVSHAHALMILRTRSGGEANVSQMDLGATLGIDKSNVARLCVRMEEAGHVTQARAPNDGRSRLVGLTARGANLATKLDQASLRRFRAMLENVKPTRRKALLASLVDLNAAVLALGPQREPS